MLRKFSIWKLKVKTFSNEINGELWIIYNKHSLTEQDKNDKVYAASNHYKNEK